MFSRFEIIRRFCSKTFLVSLMCGAAAAANQPPPSEPKPASPPEIQGEPQLEMTVRTSRTQISADSDFGVLVDLKNKSNSEIFLRPESVTMTTPTEIETGTPNPWWAVIPGGQEDPNANPDDRYWMKVVRLGPGDSTTAFWSSSASRSRVQGNPQGEKSKWWVRPSGQLLYWWSVVNFPPGEYNIKVVAQYWKDQQSAKDKANNFRSQTSETKVSVTAPEWVVLLGACLGGVLAYALLPKLRLSPRREGFWGAFWGVLTAALLSVVVTIFLDRISQSQFPVRITVGDLWGAIAVGFIAAGSGTNYLKKWLVETPLKTPGPSEASGTEGADK